jgi:hypothetical protein
MAKQDNLHFEDVECRYPKSSYGDLLFFPEMIVFLAFPRKRFLYNPLNVFLFGIIAFVMRASAINKWRDQWRGRDPRDLLDEYPHSWKLHKEEALEISHRFTGLRVKTNKDAKPYHLTLGYPQWNHIKEFGKIHGFNLISK